MRTTGLTLLLTIATVFAPGARAAPRGGDPIPAPLRAMLDRAVAHDGPLPVGHSIALVTLLRRFDLLIHPAEPAEATLICPHAPERRAITWPTLPGDDDCDLTTEAVQAYLTALLANVQACRDHALASLQAAQVAKAHLDAQVDLLPVGGSVTLESLLLEGTEPVQAGEGVVSSPNPFTDWLIALTAQAQKVCARPDPFARIEDVCAGLNGLLAKQGGKLTGEAQRADFHDILDEALDLASSDFAGIDSGATTVENGAQVFLAAFSEEAACPDDLFDLLANLQARAAFRAWLFETRAADLARRTRTVNAYLWVEGSLVILMLPAPVAGRFPDPR